MLLAVFFFVYRKGHHLLVHEQEINISQRRVNSPVQPQIVILEKSCQSAVCQNLLGGEEAGTLLARIYLYLPSLWKM